jgi:hypothetical protein
MTFKNEIISIEDEQRYNVGGVWAANRERNIFLIGCGRGREGEREFKLYISDKEYPIIISGHEIGVGNKQCGIKIRNKISHISMPVFIQNKLPMKEIVDLLVEAITEYQHKYPKGHPRRIENITVTIEFSNKIKNAI